MKPILFNSEMLRAVLDGRKTQTRRVIKNLDLITDWDDKDKSYGPFFQDEFGDSHETKSRNPYGKPGDELWVRETWQHWFDDESKYIYKAAWPDGPIKSGWKPSIFMPRSACRLFLTIKDVRVERVQDITHDDASKEGVDPGCGECGNSALPDGCGCDNPMPLHRDSFIYLWNSINEKRGFGWDVNPWVWVVEFEPLKEDR